MNSNTNNNATLGDSSSTPRIVRIPRPLPTTRLWAEYADGIEPHLGALRAIGDRLSDLAVFHEAKAITNDDVLCNVTVQAHLDFVQGFALIESCMKRLRKGASRLAVTQFPLATVSKNLDSCVNEFRNELLDGLDERESKQVNQYLDEIDDLRLRAIQAKLEITKNKES